MSVEATTLAQLAPGFTGRLLQPDDAEYEDARRVHNGLVDKRPALIARCRGVADICDAVKLARALNLEVAVRGGGHNVAGHAAIDGGMMIDLAPMKGIHVDPRARLARAQGGVLWSEFNRETQVHGLATTGGVVGSTGIAGLTLGGGLGWLMPKYGLALDNLRSAEMVMADGSVKRASADENADLFWAIRGGGGNFGIAASLEYVVHPVGPIIAGGLVAHPLAKATDVLKFFREQCASAPDELMLVAGSSPRPMDPARSSSPLWPRIADPFPTARQRSGRSKHSGRRSWMRWARSPTARRMLSSTRLYPEARSTTGSPSFSPT